jgi:hypothetical protein
MSMTEMAVCDTPEHIGIAEAAIFDEGTAVGERGLIA